MKIKKCYLNENGNKLYEDLSSKDVPTKYSTVLTHIANIALLCVLLYTFYCGFVSHNVTKAIVYLYTMFSIGVTTFIALMITIFIAVLHQNQDNLLKIKFIKNLKLGKNSLISKLTTNLLLFINIVYICCLAATPYTFNFIILVLCQSLNLIFDIVAKHSIIKLINSVTDQELNEYFLSQCIKIEDEATILIKKLS